MRYARVLAAAWLCFAGACINKLCVEGRQVECACADGTVGIQICTYEREYDECRCGSDRPPERDAAVQRDSSRIDAAPSRIDATTPMIDATFPIDDASFPWSGDDAQVDGGGYIETFHASANGFIDLFADGDSVWIVDTVAVTRRSLRDGSELGSYRSPRLMTSAAFDGTHLVVLDGAKLTTLRASDLSVVADGNLIEVCASVISISEERLVCAPKHSVARPLYVYQISTGELLASSPRAGSYDLKLRHLPGTDAFIGVPTAAGSTSSQLYIVGADDVVTQLGSPYYSGTTSDGALAFDGTPPQHLIDETGRLLKIEFTCSETTPCLSLGGALGTNTDSQRFIALDGAGALLTGIVDGSGWTFRDPARPRPGNYLLQTIDVPKRVVLAQRTVWLPSTQVVGFRAPLGQEKAVIAIDRPTDPRATAGADPGFDVYRLELPSSSVDGGT